MNAKELRAQYEAQLHERLKELDAERAEIAMILARKEPSEERRATSDDRPPRKRPVWSEARRKEQSRRMKRLHREGRFQH